MPAVNMAGPLVVPANPSAGAAVLMSPFSGPAGSPFDFDEIDGHSTGALNTGIGFGLNRQIGPPAPASIIAGGFNDNYTPGITLPNNSDATTSILTCIGGGRSGPALNGEAANTPYDAQPLLAFGNGGSRDAGAGPEFTGFAMKTVTATGTVANGATIEPGWLNRTGASIRAGRSAFGSSDAASPAVT
jgi:hypothetical protein